MPYIDIPLTAPPSPPLVSPVEEESESEDSLHPDHDMPLPQSPKPLILTDIGKQIYGISLECITKDLERLRPGIGFSIPLPETQEAAAAVPLKKDTFQLPLTFDDGVKWVLVVKCTKPPPVSRVDWTDIRTFHLDDEEIIKPGRISKRSTWYQVETEALSLQTMRGHGVMTVPNACLPERDSVVTPEFPTAHFYRDYVPGTPCPLDLFFGAPEAASDTIDRKAMQIAFIESFADHQIAISRGRLDGIGHLHLDRDLPYCDPNTWDTEYYTALKTGNFKMAYDQPPIIGPFRVEYDIDGPFKSLAEFHHCRIHKLIREFQNAKDIWPPGGRQEYLTLKEICNWLAKGRWMHKKRPNYCFRHVRNELSNYIIDEKGRLTGVLEWDGAFGAAKEEACGAPPFFRARDDQDLTFTEVLDSEPSEFESMLIKVLKRKGRDDLANCVEGAKTYRALWKIPRNLEELRRYQQITGSENSCETWPETIEEWMTFLCKDRFYRDRDLLIDLGRERAILGPPLRPAIALEDW